MGVFSKIKNIFYDTVEDETPKINEKESVKVEEIKEVRKIEEKSKEIPKKEEHSERELFQSKSTFNFPIFEDEEPLRTRTRATIEPVKERISASPYKHQEPVPKKEFKPSPVISPVYGILDKNYKREEVSTKKINLENTSQIHNAYDNVRKKAYGSLEEELENTLTKMNDSIVDTVDDITKEIEQLEKHNRNNVEDLLKGIDTDNKSITIEQAEEKYKKQSLDETISDNTLEHDLFNLIDSMYDKED